MKLHKAAMWLLSGTMALSAVSSGTMVAMAGTAETAISVASDLQEQAPMAEVTGGTCRIIRRRSRYLIDFATTGDPNGTKSIRSREDSGPYIISNVTFPSYFLKDELSVIENGEQDRRDRISRGLGFREMVCCSQQGHIVIYFC